MKRFLLIPLLLSALALGGCGPGSKVGQLLAAATTTITNPVDAVDIYRVKNTYAATLELVVEYRQYCWAKPYAALMADPVSKAACEHRRSVVLAVQEQRPKVAAAIRAAENFVRDNPTLNASSAISAAWRAVTDFQNIIPRAQ